MLCIPCSLFLLWGEIASDPRYLVVSLFIVAITGRSPPLMFSDELAGLLEDPTASVGMISWFIGVAMNLAGPIQYLV